MSHRLRIVIIEKDLFVSSDMIHTITSVLPSADCNVHASIANARASAPPDSDALLLVISAGAGGGLETSDEDASWLRKRKVIAFDFADHTDRADWVHLSKPFATQDLQEAVLSLVRVGQDNGAGAPEALS